MTLKFLASKLGDLRFRMNAFSDRYANRILSASGRDERPDLEDGRSEYAESARLRAGIV